MSRQPSWDEESTPTGSGQDALLLELTHGVMDAAVESGNATLLGQGIWWAARYMDAWWVQYENGWLRVVDAATEHDLDHVAARLAEVSALAESGEPGTLADGSSIGLDAT